MRINNQSSSEKHDAVKNPETESRHDTAQNEDSTDTQARKQNVSNPKKSVREPSQPSAFAASRPIKDHVVAGLLAIFLGALGIYKFYLGYFNAGFLMLAVSVCLAPFTFGISAIAMAILGIVEGVMYLSTDQARFEFVYVQHVREWL